MENKRYKIEKVAYSWVLAVIMTRVLQILIIGLSFSLSSCTIGELEKHEDFMSRSDCFVYKNEVEVEDYDFGRVEFIDTTKASGCVKTQLSNVYLLYQDTTCIAVYNQHPKNNITDIERFKKMYRTDTTQLSDYVKFDTGITLTISRLC
ncbi:MAG TPA: hypothetical protein VKZ45_02235, partial [Vicingaceae bacterium]|nr:hypothetical protein [Vicingaceae bacterium]